MQKAVKLMKELDAEKGIGLIEKKRLGLGKPNVIYVKNFMVREEPPLPENRADDNHNGGTVKITNQELLKSQFKNDENHNSGMVKSTIQEFPKSQPNNTEFNKTDFSETDPINPYPSDVIRQMEGYRAAIRENISYDCFLSDRNCRKEELDELVELGRLSCGGLGSVLFIQCGLSFPLRPILTLGNAVLAPVQQVNLIEVFPVAHLHDFRFEIFHSCVRTAVLAALPCVGWSFHVGKQRHFRNP